MNQHQNLTLSTDHLDIIPATYDHVSAELDDLACLASMLNADVTPEWPPGEYNRNAQEYFRNLMRDDNPEIAGWYVWYAVTKTSPTGHPVLAGAGGFMGPPDNDGMAAIGFSVIPSLRGQGIATELAGALTGWALAVPRVRMVIAETNEQNTASRRVLEKNGYLNTGSGNDPGSIRYTCCK